MTNPTEFCIVSAKTKEDVFIGYWTGKVDIDWVSSDSADAFKVTYQEADRKIEMFNNRQVLTGLIFEKRVVCGQ
jgi:hypothetical protein